MLRPQCKCDAEINPRYKLNKKNTHQKLSNSATIFKSVQKLLPWIKLKCWRYTSQYYFRPLPCDIKLQCLVAWMCMYKYKRSITSATNLLWLLNEHECDINIFWATFKNLMKMDCELKRNKNTTKSNWMSSGMMVTRWCNVQREEMTLDLIGNGVKLW